MIKKIKTAIKCISKKILILYYISLYMFWAINGIAAIRKSNNYRLPQAIVPEHYTLNINTYLENDFKFDGDVLIKLKILKPTNTVILHSVDLEIAFDQVKLVDDTVREIGIKKQYFDRSNDFYIIELKDYLQKWNQNYTLYIPFNGNLTETLSGYYRSSYIDRTSYKKKWLAITQFESTDARRAFPCFDEPEMKAIFTISLGHDRKYTAISNMPLESTVQSGYKWVVDYFAPTVKMSTYLVAYAVTEFSYRYGDNVTNTIFRVWARNDAMKQVDYAATVGSKYLEFFENYFDIPFPLPKQDMIAIPDFNAGAMENWGLITYRETALLYDSNISSAAAKHRVTSTIAHELAHQWFGNLVTMKWWSDLWLNEGFATFMAAKAVNYLNPEWNSMADEIIDNILEIYKLDRLESSHPISVPIGHPSEITHIFDIITYRKGSYIIRMMSLFLGEKVFRQGVSNYLRKYAYGNADKNDLWAALTEEGHKRGVLESDVDVKTIMDTWTIQTGYPLVTVTRNKNNHGLNIKQERFSFDSKSNDKSCWWIPLSYTTEKLSNFNDTTPKVWLKCSMGEKSLTSIKFAKDLPDSGQWVIFNIQLAGLYKVNYDIRNWELLIKALITDHNSIPVLNRAQLIDDSMDLANAGHLDYHYAFKLLRYLKHETEYLPWSVVFHHLNYLNVMLRRTQVDGIFAKYVKQLVSPIFEKVAYQLEKNSTQSIKRLVLISAWACRFGVSDCEEQANHLYATWMKMKNSDNINPIPKDLRSVVYCTAIRNGGEKEWEFLWQKYLISNVGSEKQTLLQCLGCSKEVWILKRYLDWSLKSVSGIRKQDMQYVFESVSKNIVGLYLAKEFLKTKIEELHEYFGPKSDRLSRFMKLLARQMYTTLELEEFEEFCNKYKTILKDSTVGVQQSLEKIRNNINWHAKHFNDINLLFKRIDSNLYDIM